MASARWNDLTSLPTPPDANVCTYVNGTGYTCAQAEGMGMLGMIDPLVKPYVTSGILALDQDEDAIPNYYYPEPQFLDAQCTPACLSSVCSQNSACCTQWSVACGKTAHQLCGTYCDYPPP